MAWLGLAAHPPGLMLAMMLCLISAVMWPLGMYHPEFLQLSLLEEDVFLGWCLYANADLC